MIGLGRLCERQSVGNKRHDLAVVIEDDARQGIEERAAKLVDVADALGQMKWSSWFQLAVGAVVRLGAIEKKVDLDLHR